MAVAKSPVVKPRFKKPKKHTGWNNTFVYDMGCRFRSKFEWRIARWLTKYHIKWEFEPRVQLDGSYCLPDFYLSEYETFLELRPHKRVDDDLLLKISRIKSIYQKECVLATDIEGAKTFLQRLDENRKPSKPDVIWIFSGKRGELRENKPCRHNLLTE